MKEYKREKTQMTGFLLTVCEFKFPSHLFPLTDTYFHLYLLKSHVQYSLTNTYVHEPLRNTHVHPSIHSPLKPVNHRNTRNT